MGLLDDLQVRADKIKFELQQRQNDIELQQDFYEAELKPVMLLAYEYFARLIENLKLVKPRINPGYPLNPTQKSEVILNQTDYEFFLIMEKHRTNSTSGVYALWIHLLNSTCPLNRRCSISVNCSMITNFSTTDGTDEAEPMTYVAQPSRLKVQCRFISG
jgi:hypothetical protein